MAGNAQSVVDSLLGTLASVVRDEANLLRGVRGDVQFIKGEMESMNGFLQDAATARRPNKQVEAWMKQVREVAFDSQNCIDRYVQTFGATRPSAGLLGSLRQAPKLVRTMPDRHRIAKKLRELRIQAREVGERRQRYGIKVDWLQPVAGAGTTTTTTTPGGEKLEDAQRRSALAEAVDLLDMDASVRQVVAWLNVGDHAGGGLQQKILRDIKNARSITEAINIGDKDPLNMAKALALLTKKTVIKAVKENVPDKVKQGAREIKSEIKSEIKEAAGKLARHAARNLWHNLGLNEGGYAEEKPAPAADPPHEEEKQDKLKQEAEEEEKDDPTLRAVKHAREVVGWLHGVFGGDHPRAKFLAIVSPPLSLQGDEQPQMHKRATNLARRVYNNPQVASHFECRVWVDARRHSGRRQRLECILQELTRDGNHQGGMTMSDEDLVEKIREHLKAKKRFLIVLADHEDESPWKDIGDALPTDHSPDCAIIATPLIQQKSQFHAWYIASWFFLLGGSDYKIHIYSYIETVRQKAAELLGHSVDYDHRRDIVDGILKKCLWDPFSTSLFLHALYANPHVSKEELEKLLHRLTDSSTLTNAQKTIEFCYNDLPSHYKSCLLYLSIFPQKDAKIRRSSLVRRWTADMISKRDGLSAMEESGRCFDGLIDRGLLLPAETGPTGNVKSCTVHPQVLSFITKIASDENVGNTGLPPVLAHRLSIFNGMELPQLYKKKQQSAQYNNCWTHHKPPADSGEDPSYIMVNFLNLLPASSQLGLVKVLDLEDCKGLKKRNIKTICNKLFQLRYLSLRNTNVTELPKQIEKLRYLETFDIRQTKIKSIMILQRLVHLLAGHTGSDKSFSTVHVPHGIGSMENMQTLSHVEVSDEHDFAKVGRLQHLRKLGVVMNGNQALLNILLRIVGMLNDILCSLSVHIKPTQAHHDVLDMNTKDTVISLKSLQSLSINGKITGLPTWIKELDQLSKVTLCHTSLTANAISILGELARLRYLRFQHMSYTEHSLIFHKNEFENLEFLVIEGLEISEIRFDQNTAPKLEKIVWDLSTEKIVLSGIEKLPSLREIKLNGSTCGISKPDLEHITQLAQENENHPLVTYTPIPGDIAVAASSIAQQ